VDAKAAAAMVPFMLHGTPACEMHLAAVFDFGPLCALAAACCHYSFSAKKGKRRGGCMT
jgi:hypothetical protein